eukprot:CAMPEP_0116981922 /NCGR_PEP_ID=MMETSP0467-20121206/60017_1 /TAXON_ID=283647 /ORGANISM="Mesodinium pulex, Strain SPMC105" /LENGTH=107 /DNA_ID=CAMNT_0004676279 /DNA_START=1625 /DNA_END=1948 /DNA_ORIENTATION=+
MANGLKIKNEIDFRIEYIQSIRSQIKTLKQDLDRDPTNLDLHKHFVKLYEFMNYVDLDNEQRAQENKQREVKYKIDDDQDNDAADYDTLHKLVDNYGDNDFEQLQKL